MVSKKRKARSSTTKPNARRRQRDPEATRRRLLAAGLVCFADRGYEGARLELIARRARANKAMIHYHFGSKLGLYRAIVEGMLDDARRRLEGVRAGEGDGAERLRGFVAAWGELVAAHPAFPTMMMREALAGGVHLGDAQIPRFLGVLAVVREVLEDGRRDGSLRQVDPLMTHLALVGTLLFFFATGPFRERIFRLGAMPVAPPQAAHFVVHVQDLFTRALAPGPGPRRARGGSR